MSKLKYVDLNGIEIGARNNALTHIIDRDILIDKKRVGHVIVDKSTLSTKVLLSPETPLETVDIFISRYNNFIKDANTGIHKECERLIFNEKTALILLFDFWDHIKLKDKTYAGFLFICDEDDNFKSFDVEEDDIDEIKQSVLSQIEKEEKKASAVVYILNPQTKKLEIYTAKN